MRKFRGSFFTLVAIACPLALAQCVPPGGGGSQWPLTGLTRVSVGPGGIQANGESTETAISGNGQFVAFTSSASNLVSNDTNGVTDVFLRDFTTGKTRLVSKGLGNTPANGASREPAVSFNGRYVVFTSSASNLVPNDTNNVADVFIRDLWFNATRRVSVGTNNVQFDQPSGNADISPGGRTVAFVEQVRVPVPPGGSSQRYRVAIRDLATHVTHFYNTGPSACPAAGSDRTVIDPTLGANARYLAFVVECVDPNTLFDNSRVLELDRQTSTWTQVAEQTLGPDVASGFTGTRYSADANALAWTSFIEGHGSNEFRLMVRERVDRYLNPDFSQTMPEAERPDFSADGRYLAYVGGHGDGPFESPMVPDAVHVVDLANNSTVEATAPPGVTQRFAGTGHNPAIDDSGTVVAFTTDEALVKSDTNGIRDVYATARTTAPPSVVPTIIVFGQSVREPDAGQTTPGGTFAQGVQDTGTSDIPITWHTVDGTAHAPGDYTAVTNGTASVPPNFFAGTASLPVTVIGDNTPEPDETLFVRITAPAGVRVLYFTGTVTIQDND